MTAVATEAEAFSPASPGTVPVSVSVSVKVSSPSIAPSSAGVKVMAEAAAVSPEAMVPSTAADAERSAAVACESSLSKEGVRVQFMTPLAALLSPVPTVTETIWPVVASSFAVSESVVLPGGATAAVVARMPTRLPRAMATVRASGAAARGGAGSGSAKVTSKVSPTVASSASSGVISVMALASAAVNCESEQPMSSGKLDGGPAKSSASALVPVLPAAMSQVRSRVSPGPSAPAESSAESSMATDTTASVPCTAPSSVAVKASESVSTIV